MTTPYRVATDAAPAPAKRRIGFWFAIRRWFAERSAHVTVEPAGLTLAWHGDSFRINWQACVEMRTWLLEQPEDAPIILHGGKGEPRVPCSVLIPAVYVRKLTCEFAVLTAAHERALWKPESSKPAEPQPAEQPAAVPPAAEHDAKAS